MLACMHAGLLGRKKRCVHIGNDLAELKQLLDDDKAARAPGKVAAVMAACCQSMCLLRCAGATMAVPEASQTAMGMVGALAAGVLLGVALSKRL